MVQLAFIGAGRMAQTHASALRGLSGVRILGVYDPSPAAAQSFAAAYQVPKCYANAHELYADGEIDGVLVCHYTDLHHRTLLDLFAAGKTAVFCEKALVRRVEEGRELLREAHAAGARVMVGHHRRYQAGYAMLQRVAREGRLGTIRMAKVAYCHPGYAREWGDFFADYGRSGGVTLDMMSHLFDQLHWILGEAESACGRCLRLSRSMPLPVDYVSATLAYRNGAIAGIEGSWQRYGVGYDKIELYGDEGAAIYEGSDKLRLYRAGEQTEIACPGKPPYLAQMEAFIDMVSSGAPPRVGLAEGLHSVEVALGVLEASETGESFRFQPNQNEAGFQLPVQPSKAIR